MRFTTVILGAEARSAWNWATRTSTGRSAMIGAAIAAAVGGLPVGGLIFAVGWSQARSTGDPAPLFAAAFLTMMLATFVFGLPLVVAAFFADRQLLVYAAAPVPARNVFCASLVRAALPAALVGLLPLLLALGFGSERRLAGSFFLLAVMLVALVALTAAAVSVCLMSAVLTVVPVSRSRELAAMLAGAFSVSLYVTAMKVIGTRPDQVGNRMSSFGRAAAWFPPAWPGEALSRWAVGDAEGGLILTALTAMVAAAAVAAAWVVYGRAFVTGLSLFGEKGGSRIGFSKHRRPRAAARVSAARPAAGLARKDLVSLRRDFKRMANVVPALMMAGAYSVVMIQAPPPGVSGFWSIALPLLCVAVIVSFAVALPAVSNEGRAVHLVRLAGLRMRRFLAAKVLFAAATVSAVTVLAALFLAVATGLKPVEVTKTLFVAVWLGLGLATIGATGGAIEPKFEAENPRHSVGVLAALCAMVAMIFYIGFSYGAVAAFEHAAGGGSAAVVLAIVGAALMATAAAVVAGMVAAGLHSLSNWRFE